jgi:hypothetical protein
MKAQNNSSFIYTGCKGNRNRFETEDQCRRTCVQGYTAADEGVGGWTDIFDCLCSSLIPFSTSVPADSRTNQLLTNRVPQPEDDNQQQQQQQLVAIVEQTIPSQNILDARRPSANHKLADSSEEVLDQRRRTAETRRPISHYEWAEHSNVGSGSGALYTPIYL